MTKRGIPLQAVVDLRAGLQDLECYRKSFSWENYRLRMCHKCDAQVLAHVYGFLDIIGVSPSDARPNPMVSRGGTPPADLAGHPRMSAGAAALDDPA